MLTFDAKTDSVRLQSEQFNSRKPKHPMESSSSVSSDQKPQWKYHVFLSFRGEDTRNSFADHLYAALKENGIQAFRDDEELDRGEIISESLVKAIQESLFAIVILSPNYPSSSWCLDELQEILESRKLFGRQAFPVFYGVDPSHVRHQKESFAEAFKKHEERFGEDSIKVQKWREALREIANLSGWDSRNWREAKLIEQIVREICRKLQPLFPSQNDELVGIDSRINEIYSLLKLYDMNNVHFIGIWGMGGIGKTTLARVVYERIKNQFDGSCFLQDVREISDREGLVELQRKLLADVKVKGMEIKDQYDGKKAIRNLLCNKRILLILDDVSAVSQLENLAGNQKWFGPGSKVIVTTRNKQLMKAHGSGTFGNYEVELLNSNESLELFCQKAFKGEHPKEGYFGLSESMVQYARGLPLALGVLGSFLYGRSILEWKDALDMLKQDPQNDILKTLRLSYDGLEYTYKTIFLDIACFFKGWDRNHVTHISQICGRNATIGIEVLIEKSLITYDGQNLGMHDLVQDMGKHIVFHESPNDAGERSRLWSREDVDYVLTKNKGSKAIQGIILNLLESCEAHWNPKAFSKISNLKLLIIKTKLNLSSGLNCLSDGLRVLEWDIYPLVYLPLGIQLNDLVDLRLHQSKIKQLWDGIKFFQKLKLIDLSHSKYLIRTPNVCGVPYLETLILEGCINLVEVHRSIHQHKKLVTLNLKDCLNLKILPNKLEMNSLENFILSGCSKVKKLPEFGHKMECLLMLDLKNCENLICLPDTIRNLKSLKILNISGCSKFSKIPNNIYEIVTLEEFDASGTAIREVPSSIVHLENLQKLSFRGCKGSPSNSWDLSLPLRWFQKFRRHQEPTGLILHSISQMPMLKELDLSYCNLGDGSMFNDLGRLSSLSKLDLSGNNFVNLPTHSLAHLSKLYYLDVNRCAKLRSLPTLPSSLQWLSARDCTSMEFVSYSQQLCDFFGSHNYQMEDWIHRYLVIPGSEIPTWFDNQNYCSEDILLSAFPKLPWHCDSIVSIIVDIPDHCRLRKSWGIVVCLVLEYTTTSSLSKGAIKWTCKAPEDDFSESLGHDLHGYWIKEFNYPHLCIMFLSSEEEKIKKNLIIDKNQLELVFYSACFPNLVGRGSWEGSEEDSKLKIRKCGCRLLWKDNVETWSKSTRVTEVLFDKRCRDGSEEDDAALSSPRPSKRGKLD